MSPQQSVDTLRDARLEPDRLDRQLDWFKRQISGEKREWRVVRGENPRPMS